MQPRTRGAVGGGKRARACPAGGGTFQARGGDEPGHLLARPRDIGAPSAWCQLSITGPPKAPARGAAQLKLDERPADELRDELPHYGS
jgi:hypothetical protein